ncbi:MAG: hypothetical protein ACOYN4_21245 [Bacteroidales bacterium]
MKKYGFLNKLFVVAGFCVLIGFQSCNSGNESKSAKSRKLDSIALISSNIAGTGKVIEIQMLKGKAHNHPTFAIWLEDQNGMYIQTLFITKAFAQGVFEYGDKSAGNWAPGEVQRPAALPYWVYKRNESKPEGSLLPSPKNKMPDAYTGATPAGNFALNTRTDKLLIGKVNILLEINQTWDWNQYWTNGLYPDDADYQSSCQPAIVYSGLLDLGVVGSTVLLKPIGHSHYSGKKGELYPDLSTITTALHIAEQITATVK